VKTFEYSPKGVCATKFTISIDNHKIHNFKAINGCAGNLAGISKLVEGMDVDEVIKRLQGVQCHTKGTSCPDQIARFLIQIKDQID
jgi:uncharacterized protein (TIGR03905 family)